MLKLEVIGHIGSDAVLKDFNGKKYIAFNVAHSERYKDPQGNPVERTTWVSVLKPGESGILPYLKKGTGVYVCGDLSVKIYVDSRRQTQAGVNCLAREVQLLPGGRREEGCQAGTANVTSQDRQDQQNHTCSQTTNPASVTTQNEVETSEDDLPF